MNNKFFKKEDKIIDVINMFNETGDTLAIIVDEDFNIVGVVSDGDIRRALYKNNYYLDDQLKGIINYNPILLTEASNVKNIVKIMREKGINKVPFVQNRKFLKLVNIDDLLSGVTINANRNINMFIMAGGFGKRMRPLTEHKPKPMLEVDGKPILEHIVNNARNFGINNYTISLGYLGDQIESYFGDGKAFGVNIDYVREDKPLGTAGALSLVANAKRKQLIVINGDVLSAINYGHLLSYHNRSKAQATIVIKKHFIQNPYGTVFFDSNETLIEFTEKPVYESWINAGIYVLEPSTYENLPSTYLDMPDLLLQVSKKSNVKVFKMNNDWLDIGRPADLDFANKRFLTDE
jgi:dTDP-glucose pyrophosphorylase/CBS domain-containing protein